MSSEHDVSVIRVGSVEKHPNADALAVTRVDGRPVICRLGEYAEGDLAVYIPVDTLVPVSDPRFSFLAARGANTEGFHRVRAVRLRGTFSMGLLVPASLGWAVGQRVEAELGTRVYEPPVEMTTGGDNEPDPGFMPTYTDIESFRKWREVFRSDERVVATEKIHGANGRFVWKDGRLWCGSRTGIKKEDPRSIWWQAAAHAGLAERLQRRPGIALYGEVYGQVQDLKYGVSSGVRFVAFDALDTSTRSYLPFDAFVELCRELEVPMVPVLYDGPFAGLSEAMANGATVLASGACVREGFVVRPAVERFDDGLGRVIVKLVGEDYLLRKQA